MDSPPSRDRGLPPGVDAAPLGLRFVAYVIDLLVPAVAGALVGVLLPGLTELGRLLLGIGCSAAVLGWVVLVWFMLAERAATPGMRAVKLQLVGYYDGRPIGWGRVLLRALVYYLLQLSGLGWIIMLVLMILHPRHQGWHDLVVQAVMIKERSLAPPRTQRSARSDQQPAIGYGSGQQPDTGYEPVPAAAPNPVSYGPQARYSPVPGPAPSSPPPSPPPLTPPQGSGYPTPGSHAPAYPPQSAPSAPPQSASSAPPQSAQSAPPRSAPSAPPPEVPVEDSAGPDPTEPMSTVSPSAYAAEPAPEASWVAVMDDGRRISIGGLVLLGRNPQPQPGEEDAHLIKLADETRTVSKSHLGVGVDGGGIYVMDRGSTNGSTVTTASGQSTRCTPGVRVYVDAGSIISIGDHWLEIRRG